MEPPYCYRALLPQRNSIRVLRLLPSANQNVRIEGELFDFTLDEIAAQPHPYEALSYAWGSITKSSASISIDKQSLGITSNLHKALLHLRNRFLPRIIWIDAVCIDQENHREKEGQIQLMPKIYSSANCVIIWLGEQADGSDQALEELRIAGSNKAADSTHDETIQERVIKLLQRDWFWRIWVLV